MGYFSEWSLSFAFGIVWTKTHAFNIFIDNNKKIWIIEPQTDQIFSLDEVKENIKYYPFELVLI